MASTDVALTGNSTTDISVMDETSTLALVGLPRASVVECSGTRNLCSEYERLNKRANALDMCGRYCEIPSKGPLNFIHTDI